MNWGTPGFCFSAWHREVPVDLMMWGRMPEHSEVVPVQQEDRGWVLARRRRRRVALAALLAVVVAVGVVAAGVLDGRDVARGPQPGAGGEGFVSRSGTQLYLGGQPFRFTGYNNYVMLGCGFPQERVEGAAREEFFASLRPNSVVRVAVIPGTDLARFDTVVSTAREYGQRLVIILADAHGYCGGTEKDDAWYAGGFRGEYFDWVRTVVPRYRDESTIAMWELINEPYASDTATLRAFFDAAGGLVHELDPNHLVSSGTLQPATYGGVGAFTKLSASPGVDVVSLHEYDEVADASHHLAPAVGAAVAVDKPLMVGEWGLMARPPGVRGEDGGDCYTFGKRVEVAEGKLMAYFDEPVVAGALYWSYTAENVSECKLSTTQGDPLVELIRTIPIPLPDEY